MPSPSPADSSDTDSSGFTTSIAINPVRLSWPRSNQSVHIPKPPQRANGVPIEFPFMARICMSGTWSRSLTLDNDSVRRGFISATHQQDKLRCRLAMERVIDVDIAAIRVIETTTPTPSSGKLALKLQMSFYEVDGLMDLLDFMNAAYNSASGTGFLEVEILRNGKKAARKQLPIERCLRNVDVPNATGGRPWSFTVHLPLKDLAEGDEYREFSGLKYDLQHTDPDEQVEVRQLECFFCGLQCATIDLVMNHLKYHHKLTAKFEKHPLHKSSASWGMITVFTPPRYEGRKPASTKVGASESLDSQPLPTPTTHQNGTGDNRSDQRKERYIEYNLPLPDQHGSKSTPSQNKPASTKHVPVSPRQITPYVYISYTRPVQNTQSEPQRSTNTSSSYSTPKNRANPGSPQPRDSRGQFSSSSLSSHSVPNIGTPHKVLTKARDIAPNQSSINSYKGDENALSHNEKLNDKEDHPIVISSDSEESKEIPSVKKAPHDNVRSKTPESRGVEIGQKKSLPRPESKIQSFSRSKPSGHKSNDPPKKPPFCTEVEPLPPIKKRKLAVPKAPPGVTFYRNASKRRLEEGELLSDSDSEVDNTYTKMRHRRHLDKIRGATEAEKAFIKLFDNHFQDERHSGDKFIGEGLIRLAVAEKAKLKHADMYQLFCTQAAILKAENIVSDAQVVECMDIIRGLNDSDDDVRWKDLGPPLFSKHKAKLASKDWQQTCICGEVVEDSYGIVCCKNTDCDISVFHLKCAGFEKAPKEWICNDCTGRDKMTLD